MNGNGLGTDITELAAETAGFAVPLGNDGYPFSGKEIRATFLTSSDDLGDMILRSVFEKPIAHLRAMQIEQGMRVLRQRARGSAKDLPDGIKSYAELPASLLSSLINGLVAAAKDGGARNEALAAWGGGSIMARRRSVGDRIMSPRDATGAKLS